ncbi:MAG: TetR/AcrR family transcriptional regulator [Deinococcota bacterium]
MTATRNRSHDAKAKVRTAMLEAAGELLIEHGYEGLTLAKVAKKVGFATTNIYRYFDSKDDLLYATIEDAFVEFGERLEHAYVSQTDPIERLLALGHAYVDFADEHPVPYTLMFVLKTDYLFSQRQVPGIGKLGYLTKAIEEGMTTGAIRQVDAPALSHVLWGLLHGIVTLADAMPLWDEYTKEAALHEAFKTIRLSLMCK